MPEDQTSSEGTGSVKPGSSSIASNSNEDWSDSSDFDEPVLGRRGWIRLAWIAAAVVVVVLLVTLPPLVNVNRYQKRVAQAISGAIGRPVHFDSITMHLLPLPGFTIQNFVVQEDPAFGTEPAMRSNVVHARVRFASLWRRRMEISRIRLEAPSVNLVRRSDGRWNLQGVVMQASQLESAPTAQLRHSTVPRFPYIEAVDARINIKQDDEKLPWSLVDAKFALWLPDQNEWKLRLQGRPLRTDTDVSDVGSLRVEGTLGRNNGGAGENLDLHARLDSTPMGEAAKLVLGHDTGWRGAASADLSVHGTSATMLLTTDLHLHNLRRAEFVPRLPMSVDAHCEGQALGGFHQVRGIRCAIPTLQSTSLLDAMDIFDNKQEHVLAAPDVLSITAEVPDTLDWRSVTAKAELRRGSPEWALGWLRLFSTRLPADEQVGGSLTLQAQLDGSRNWEGIAACRCSFPTAGLGAAEKTESKAPQAGSGASARTRTAAQTVPPTATRSGPDTGSWNIVFSHVPMVGDPGGADTIAINAGPALAETPVLKEDAAGKPALPSGDGTISGQISRSGYTLRYASAEIARHAASLLPPLGDGLSPEVTGPVQVDRTWSASQTWTSAATVPARTARRAAKHRSR